MVLSIPYSPVRQLLEKTQFDEFLHRLPSIKHCNKINVHLLHLNKNIFDSLNGFKFYTTLNFPMWYHKVKMHLTNEKINVQYVI